MQRVTRSTAVGSLPAVPGSPSTPGYFSGGNPGGGIPATAPGYEWYNGVQEELIAVIVAAGLTPDQTNNAQLLAALRTMYSRNLAVFTSSGTFTVPPGITTVRARVWAAGGGGGGCTGTGGASGGGGGGYAERIITGLTPGGTVAITVGAGGAAGSNSGTNGSAGGSSSFGSYCSATGGGGGYGSSGGYQSSQGTAGAGSGGTLNISGSSGFNALTGQSGSTWYGGGGGGAVFSAGPTPNAGSTPWFGNFPGGGGSAGGSLGNSANNGGVGAGGLVLIDF